MPWPSWSTTLGLFGTGLRTSCEAGKSRLRRRRIIVNGPSSYSTPSTWASSSSRPAKVLLLDGPSTMGKSQAVTSYMLRESERLRAERGRRVDRCRSPPSLSPTSPTTETRAMSHSRTWPCQLELVVHQAGSGAPWLAR